MVIGDSLASTILSDQLVWTVVILGAAAFIQATVGFAAALFAIPLLLWAGIDLMSAQVLLITAMMPQNVLLVWKLRKSIKIQELLLPATVRLCGLPIGVAGLAVVLTWSPAAINQLVGAIILLAVAMQGLIGIEWKTAARWYWIVVTFGGSGVLQGLSGMSGPPMVLWVHGQRYSADRARVFLFSMYITVFVPQLLLLWWRFGSTVWQAVGSAFVSIPIVIVSAMLGLRVGSWLGDRWLRPISYACLAVLGLYSLLAPWLRFQFNS